jgi:uncharacterized protein (DUF2147 family)
MKTLISIAAILLAATSSHASGQSDVIGSWMTVGNSSHVEIYPCGEKLCGKVAWLKNPNYIHAEDGPVGTTKVDRKNPDPNLRNRPILGLQVIEGLTAVNGGSWEKGKCYDPESGNTYKCRMHLASPEKLEMRGYVGIPLFGRTYVLTRENCHTSRLKAESGKTKETGTGPISN